MKWLSLLDPGSDPTKGSQSFVMEALRMTDLNHPNVMNLLGICWSPNSENVRYTLPLVVLPYMMLGDLRTHLRRKRIKTTSHLGGTTTSCNESTTEVVHWSDKCSLSEFLCRVLFRQLSSSCSLVIKLQREWNICQREVSCTETWLREIACKYAYL